MITSPESTEISTTFTSKISTPKIEKALEKIQRLKSTSKPIQNTSPVEPKAAPHGTVNLTSIPFENVQEPNRSTSQSTRQQQRQPIFKPQQQNETRKTEKNEEHYVPTTSPGRSSISDIK